MAEQIQCPGCAARFRLRLRSGAPERAALACPRCGETISIRRARNEITGTNSARHATSTVTKTEPSTPRADREHLPDVGESGWRTVEHSAVFGRPSPPPPSKPKKPRTTGPREFTSPQGPRLGLFGGGSGSGNNEDVSTSAAAPRLPENDRPDGVRPLASALLQELRQQRAGATANSKPRADSSSKTTSPRTDSSAEEIIGTSTEIPEADPDAGWLDDELIAEAADAAADELLFIDDAPPTFDRLRGAFSEAEESEVEEDDVAEDEPITVETIASESVDTAADEMATATPPPPIPGSEPDAEPKTTEPEPEPPREAPEQTVEPPIELKLSDDPSQDDEPQHAPHHQEQTKDVPSPETLYRLRIGAQIYGDITFDGLLSLFRRGIWVVADQIAEDDGPWMPIESHPIFDRVRHAIADGLTNLLMTHGRLIDERPGGEATPSQIQPSTPPPATIEKATVQPDEPERSQQVEAVPTIRTASATLPWTIALITTGVASAAVTFGFFAEPILSAGVEDDPSAIAAPALVEDVDVDKSPGLAAEATQRKRVDRTREMATEIVGQALEIEAVELAATAIERGEFDRARRIAAQGLQTGTDRETLQELFDRAIIDDPELQQNLRTMTAERSGDTLRSLGGGASVTLRFTSNSESRYAFKVDRQYWRDGWKVEVAAFKLCQILPCDHYLPLNESARISREDFDELYGRVDTQRQRAYANERFDELLWNTEPGPDGVEREYLYGTLKEWIPRYTKWPIEYTETWQDWLDIERDESVFDESFADYLDRLDEVYDGRFTSGLRREAGDTSIRDLARQLSNLHVFDYLTSNFDRYSGIEDYYGVNAHFADGRFVPLDNSAAFQFVDRPAMPGRLARIQRFSRPMIDAVRLLRPEVVDPIFFPNATSREQERLQIFWERRTELLDHVDRLVEDHGEERVYAFH